MNFLQEAFEEALKAVGVSFPNPAVGAVVVKEGKIVGRGHTQVVHGPHAEVMALRDAGELANGATLFVTLEPCCHYGRTPPCTNAIIQAKIQRVFFAHRDPNPLVLGKSERILADAGIVSEYVEPPQEFLRYYEAYDYFVKYQRPFIELKIAESADGFIANADRAPVQISGNEASIWTAKWRRTAECILIGGGTALADNPRLTVRGVCGNSPQRIVLAGARLLPRTLHLFEMTSPKTIVYSRIPQPDLKEIAELKILPRNDFTENWKCILRDLQEKGIHRLAVETGATLMQKILKSGLWNRIYVIRSQKKLGNGLAWRSGNEPAMQCIEKFQDDEIFSAIQELH